LEFFPGGFCRLTAHACQLKQRRQKAVSSCESELWIVLRYLASVDLKFSHHIQEAVKTPEKPKRISNWIHEEIVIHVHGQLQEKIFKFTGNLPWPKR
jgi:hypothetical protein